jgi:hypothetical protein
MIYDCEARAFYILANKFEGRVGIYLIQLEEENPEEISLKILLKNQLDISDCNMVVYECK